MNNYKIKIEKFEGPLDLLLQLIEKEKLDITEVSLSKVTEQYLESIKNIEEYQPEDLADFLVVATKLLLLKSKTLLPYLYPEEEDEGNLAEQLKIYKEFLDATKEIEKILKNKKFIYPKQQIKLTDVEVKYSPPEKLKTQDLKKTFIDVIKKLEPIVRLPKAALTRAVSLREKIADIQEAIFRKTKLTYHELLVGADDRTEVIVTFLALLELTKQKIIRVEQGGNFEDINIKNYKDNNQD